MLDSGDSKKHWRMRTITFIEDSDVIKKIIKHLGQWEIKQRPPPKSSGLSKTLECSIDYSASQISAADKWLHVDPLYTESLPS